MKRKKLKFEIDKARDTFNEKATSPLSQMAFCKKFGITTMTYNNYKAGKIPDSIRLIDELLNETGLEFNELIKRKR